MKRLSPTFVALVIALTTPACSPEVQVEEAMAAPPVHVEQAHEATILPSTSGTADLEPIRQAALSVDAPGRVVALEFDRGQQVTQGQVLLRLDVGRTNVAAQAARAQVTQARASLAQARRERELAERLLQSGSTAQRAFDQAADGERLALAAVEASEAQLRLTQRGLTEAVVRAPFSGVIVDRRIEVGEFASPGQPVAVLMDRSILRARVLLNAADALDVTPGTHANVVVFARPDERFEGEVRWVGEAVDAQTHRLPVEIEVADPNHRLRPGLVARLSVQTGAPRTALLVRTAAIFERYEHQEVYVVRDNVAHRQAIETGEIRDNMIEITSGITATDVIVIDGQDRVVDGAAVLVVDNETNESLRAERTHVP